MFKFLKDKLKKAVSKFSKEVAEEGTEVVEEVTEKPEPVQEEKQPELEEKVEEKKEEVSEPDKKEESSELKEEEKESVPEDIKVEEKKPEEEHVPEEEKNPDEEVHEEQKESEIEPQEEIPTEEEPEQESPEETQQETPEVPEKKGFFSKIFKKKEDAAEKEPEQEEKPEQKEKTKETLKKKSIFSGLSDRVTKFNLKPEKFEQLFWELEVTLLENNVAVEVIEKIKKDLEEQLTTEKVSRRGVEQVILDTLKQSLADVFSVDSFDLLEKAKVKKPYVISMIGVNGSGKTTTMAKLGHLFQKNGLKVVMAASDTFRAAAIQQLEEHAQKLDIKLIKHDYKSDPAAVAYDAIEHAKAHNLDIVLIDTAGRLHSNKNLMDELHKLLRVNKPDLKIFIGESTTGNDCVEQAKHFDDAVGIDAIILAKADVDEKGGAAISVSYITKKPILYLGTGQTYDDLIPFEKETILENLGL